jgi:hypothetical protein
METKSQKKEISHVQRFKLEKGEWLGTFPLGYKVQKPVEQKRTKFSNPFNVEINEKESSIVKDLFYRYSLGTYSVNSLYTYMLDVYGPIRTKSSLHRLLKNTFYYGYMMFKGELFPHKYPKLITKEMFDLVQKISSFNNKYTLYADINTVEEECIEKEGEETLNSISLLFKEKRNFEELLILTSLSRQELLDKLFDWELDNKIREEGGLWILNKNN